MQIKLETCTIIKVALKGDTPSVTFKDLEEGEFFIHFGDLYVVNESGCVYTQLSRAWCQNQGTMTGDTLVQKVNIKFEVTND